MMLPSQETKELNNSCLNTKDKVSEKMQSSYFKKVLKKLKNNDQN